MKYVEGERNRTQNKQCNSVGSKSEAAKSGCVSMLIGRICHGALVNIDEVQYQYIEICMTR